MTCETSAASPMVDITADIASSTGIPAATNAPNAMARITRVSGIESFSAFWKSFPSASLSALSALAMPNCSTRRSEWDFCRAATVSID